MNKNNKEHTVIRNGMFETNSSSVHAIILGASDSPFIDDELTVDENDICWVFSGEFGWGPERYSDADTKISYCYTYLSCYVGDEEKKEKLKKMLVKIAQEQQPNIKQVNFEDCRYPHIDHQSIEIPSELFEKGEEALTNFIFNCRSVLIIDHDNH